MSNSREAVSLWAFFPLLLFAVPMQGQAPTQSAPQTCPLNCSAAPYSVPPGCATTSTTAVQDQAHMMCQLGLQFPTAASNPPLNPTREGDPYAPPNAFPLVAAEPETQNWTDALRHTIVRWQWGLWTTYDDSQSAGMAITKCANGTCVTLPGTSMGGAMNQNYGDYGPAGARPYPDPTTPTGLSCSSPGCLASSSYPPIDLFLMKDGVTKIKTPTDWWLKRRPEIFNLVQQEIYGYALPPSASSVINSWTISPVTTGSTTGTIGCNTQAGLPTNAPTTPSTGFGYPATVGPYGAGPCTAGITGNGDYTYAASNGTNGEFPYRQKTYTATFAASYNGYSPRTAPTLSVTCWLPDTTRAPFTNITGKVPVVISIAESQTNFTYTAPYGYGVCGYTQTTMQPDAGGEATTDYLDGLINGGNWRQPTSAGTLVEWAWGISRLIDEFANDPDPNGPDPDKVAVEGHSRDGKATLVTAAYDDRIVAALPSCGGEGGTSWLRRAYGESIESIVGDQEYYWMDGYLMRYAGPECQTNPDVGPKGCTPAYFPRRVQDLDVDSHSVLSLIAPRAVMTNGGTDSPIPGLEDAWQDPRGMFLSGAAASPVWNLLGWTGQIIPEGTQFTDNPTPYFSGESIGGTPPFNVPFVGLNGPGGSGSATVGYRRHTQGHTDVPEWPVFAQWAAQYLWDKRPVIKPGQTFTVAAGTAGPIGPVAATAGGGGPLQSWQIKGGNGAYIFAIDPTSGTITAPTTPSLGTYSLTLMVGDSLLPSHDQTVTINVVPFVPPPGITTGCVYVLDPSAPGALTVSGSASLNVPACDIIVDSNSASAMAISGSACVSGSGIQISGSYSDSSNCPLNPAPTIGVAPVADPLANLEAPTVSGKCDYINANPASGTTLNPGVYCNGINVNGGAAVNFNPGTYILLGGGLNVSGHSSISGQGVSFYNTYNSSYAYKPIVISGGNGTNVSASISASTSGPLAGVLFFQDRSVSGGPANVISGMSGAQVTGVLYFPTTPLVVSGASSMPGAPYSVIVADTLNISGSSSIGGSTK